MPRSVQSAWANDAGLFDLDLAEIGQQITIGRGQNILLSSENDTNLEALKRADLLSEIDMYATFNAAPTQMHMAVRAPSSMAQFMEESLQPKNPEL